MLQCLAGGRRSIVTDMDVTELEFEFVERFSDSKFVECFKHLFVECEFVEKSSFYN